MGWKEITGLVCDGQGGLQLQNVSFTYQLRPDHRVLNEINLDIKPGSVCALVRLPHAPLCMSFCVRACGSRYLPTEEFDVVIDQSPDIRWGGLVEARARLST